MPVCLQDDDPFLTEEFYRPASGAGGQHLNRTESGVRLIFDYMASPRLTEEVKARITSLAGSLLSGGKLVIQEKESRSLHRNRETAKQRLDEFLEKASRLPKKRKKTKATKASKERRLATKAIRSAVKANRRKPLAD